MGPVDSLPRCLFGGHERRVGVEVCHSFQECLGIRFNEQCGMVRFEKKLIFGDGFEERLEVVEKTIDVQNAARFLVKPELEPGEGFEQFFESPDAAGKSNETVAEIHHELFALVHGVDDTKVGEPGVSEFSFHQRFGDDADDMSSGLKMGIRDDAHETEVASTVNQPDSEVGHSFSEGFGGCAVEGIGAGRGAAVDAKTFHGLRVSSLKRKGLLPVMSELVKLGHQCFSTCSTTRSVPVKWSTPGGRSGLYMVSVMSRMRATFFPK